MFFDDECSAERHHHEDAENAAREGQHRDLHVIEIAGAVRGQENKRRHREDHTAGDGLTGGSNRLHDVVLENRGTAQPLQHGNGEHGDRNRCAHRQAGTQAEIHRRRSEQQAEERTENHRAGGELGG